FSQWFASGVVHAERAVDALAHEAVPDPERLVGWLPGELAAAVGKPLVAVVEAVEAAAQFGIRLRPPRRAGRHRLSRSGADRAVHARTGIKHPVDLHPLLAAAAEGGCPLDSG